MKQCPAPMRRGVLLSQFDHRGVGAGAADQAFAGRLAEGQAELDARHGGDQGLVDVLDRLDEMGLAQDEVRSLRLVDLTVMSCMGVLRLAAQLLFLNRLRTPHNNHFIGCLSKNSHMRSLAELFPV